MAKHAANKQHNPSGLLLLGGRRRCDAVSLLNYKAACTDQCCSARCGS